MTKLRVEQLSSQLKQGIAIGYCVSGDETLLVHEACDQIRQAAKQQGFAERELFHVDKQFDWNLFSTSANSLSLFSEKKIIELRIDSGKPGDKGSKAIVEYLDNPNPDNCLLIVTAKLDASSQRSKWVKALEKHAQWIPIWPIGPTQLPRWLEQRLQKKGMTADSQSIDLLAARTEGNLLAAHQEIEKLALLSSDSYLTPELVSGAVADSARYDVFTLVDKGLHGDGRGAVKTLHGLRGEGTEPAVILWALAREIRVLLSLQASLNQGQAFSWAAKRAGIWEKRQPLAQQAIRRLSQGALQGLLKQANQIDRAIKGLYRADPWAELLDLTLSLAGTETLSSRNRRLAQLL